MLHLFSTKAALRKAMVGLSNYTGAYPSSGKTIEAIANYLTEGGISQMDAKIKAQEGIVKSLERQSKSLAEELGKLEDEIEAQKRNYLRCSEKVKDKDNELSGLRGDIATAQEQLDSLVAQIGSASEICEVYKDDFKGSLLVSEERVNWAIGEMVNVLQDGIFDGEITRIDTLPHLQGGTEVKVWVKDQYGDEYGYPPAAISILESQ